MKDKTIIIVTGATATGKTGVAIQLYKSLKQKGIISRIINFDSLLFYKELNIGTAKPTSEELLEAPHELISICSAKDHLNAARYSEIALPLINKCHGSKEVVILVGGSGFYLRALIKGMYNSPATPKTVKDEVEKIFDEDGILGLITVLKERDPATLDTLHPNDEYRIMRAVEHIMTTGGKFSSEREKMDKKGPYNLARGRDPLWNILHFNLDIQKDEHYRIIESRTKQMFEAGLVDEVTELLKSGFTGKEKPLQSIGYKETIALINGDFKSVAECMERISISTRQLAKAQRTWFKRSEERICLDSLSIDVISQIENKLFSK